MFVVGKEVGSIIQIWPGILKAKRFNHGKNIYELKFEDHLTEKRIIVRVGKLSY